MLTKRKRRIIFYLSTIAFAVLLVPVFLFSFGYGVGPGFVIQKTGGIAITASESGATVSVSSAGRTKQKTTSFISKTVLVKNLLPSTYAIRVEKDGFFPYTRELKVFSERVTARDALLVPRELSVRALGTSTPEAWQAIIDRAPILKRGTLLSFSSVKKFWTLPNGEFLVFGDDKKFYKNGAPFDPAGLMALESDETRASEIFRDFLQNGKNIFFTKNGERIILWDSYSINSYWLPRIDKIPEWQREYAEGGDTVDTFRFSHIFSAPNALRSVFPYEGRDNYLVVEMQNGIFALEMESPKNNIAPLYKGITPKIIATDKQTMLIFDDGKFFEIQLPR